MEFAATMTSGVPIATGISTPSMSTNACAPRSVFDALPPVRESSPAHLRAQLACRGAVTIDTRSPERYAAGHLSGSINVGLIGGFAETLWMVSDSGDAILLITELPAGRHGVDRVPTIVARSRRAL